MKLFLHTSEKIRIINEAEEFVCTPEEFAALEPEYPGLPEGRQLRYWTPEVQRFDLSPYDDHDCGPYVAQCGAYTPTIPEIPVTVTLSRGFLAVNADPAQSITFNAEIHSPVPITHAWFMPLRHENGESLDRIAVHFVESLATEVWTYREGLPLGWWELREADFDLIDLGGQLYRPTLTQAVKYCLYRDL